MVIIFIIKVVWLVFWEFIVVVKYLYYDNFYVILKLLKKNMIRIKILLKDFFIKEYIIIVRYFFFILIWV